MALNIIRQEDAYPIEPLKIMIYGVSNTGKTSIGFTSKKPLLIDTDKGASRSDFRKDSVYVKSWEEVQAITGEDIKDYDTIVLDTVGMALDLLTRKIIADNPKLGFNGALSPQGWGQLKIGFSNWTDSLKKLGKDIVFIAHNKEEKADDDMIYRPDISGGSYTFIRNQCDIIGYMYFDGKQTLIDFGKSTKFVTKNIGLEDRVQIPSFHQVPDFLEGLMTEVREIKQRNSEAQQEVVEQINEWRERIENVESIEEFNEIYYDAKSIDNASVKTQVRGFMLRQYKEYGYEFDKENEIFVAAEEDEGDEPEQADESEDEAEEEADEPEQEEEPEPEPKPKSTKKKVAKKVTKKKSTKKVASKKTAAPTDDNMASNIDKINACQNMDELESLWEEIEANVGRARFTSVYHPIIMARSKVLSESE